MGLLPIMGVFGDAPPERGTFFRLEVKKGGISGVKAWERVRKTATSVFKKVLKYPQTIECVNMTSLDSRPPYWIEEQNNKEAAILEE